MNNKTAVLTNLAYGVTALAVLQEVAAGILVAIFAFNLMLQSGIHHWNLGAKRFDTDATKALDYAGMNGVLLALLALGAGASAEASWLLILITVVVIGMSKLRDSRAIIGGLIGALVVMLFIKAGAAPTLQVLAWMGISFVFNTTGDVLHKDHHSIIHGLGWHVPTAYAIYLTAGYLA